MAGYSTTKWSVGESALVRNSFNSIVSRKECDVPCAMWQTVKMGRQAELGHTWSPNGIFARVVNGTLDPEQLSSSSPLARHTLTMTMPLPPAEKVAASPVNRRPRSASTTLSELQARPLPKSLLHQQQQACDSTALLKRAGPAASEPNLMLTSSSAGRTATISRKAPGATVNWSATELTMQRHSFNAMVKRQTFDAPQSIQLTMTMGRKAEYGKNYVPNPIAARQLAGTLAMPKSKK
mmetsp:Transcript_58657/g.168454  ORF Transcript_58657/g.168454 Transcript_58657/m.168454 type:complete len:237 (-) Transcript_58657:170-880(-)